MTNPAKRKPRRKATKPVACQRTEQVLAIRLDGAEFWDVRDYVRDEEKKEGSLWFLKPGEEPMSDSQIWRYMQKADELLRQTHEKSRASNLRRHLAQRRRLYARAVAAGDTGTALAVLKDEAKMLDLYPNADDTILREIARAKEELNKTLAEEGTGINSPEAGPGESPGVDGPLQE